MASPLGEGERGLGEWAPNHLPPAAGRCTGKPTVTDRRRLFAAAFATSPVGTPARWASVEGGHGYVEIPQASICSVEGQRRLLEAGGLVTVEDGDCHTLDGGTLSVDEIAAAIESR